MKKYIKISGKEKEWIGTALNVSPSMVEKATLCVKLHVR